MKKKEIWYQFRAKTGHNQAQNLFFLLFSQVWFNSFPLNRMQ